LISQLCAADDDDLSALASLVALGSTTLDVKAELARSFSRLWVARTEGKLVGFLLAWDVADEVHLLDLVVSPELRRKGIGRSLLNTLLAHAHAQRARKVLLEVRKRNHAARRLYESAQFAEVGERRAYYEDGEDAILMSLELEPC
jgi:ribosomal-protein-alanine N-acetyltransferase